MSPLLDGQLLTLDLVVAVAGLKIKITGTVEVLGIRRRVA